ncbi:MAG: hypothetical protein ACTSPO_13150 [Candidatus Heimdallarchaeaceae archaeon]
MPPETDIDLPMFLHVIPPMGIVILNNEIIHYDPYGADVLFPHRMLELLSTMYNNNILRDELPSKFYHLFENRKICVTENCLTGIDELPPSTYVYMCLKFEKDIKKDSKKKIHLHKLNYNRNELHMSINLEATNFFFILANLCVDFVAKYNYTYQDTKRSEYRKRNKNYSNTTIIYNFALRYLKFVAEELKKNEIKPDYILSNGGIHTLMFLRDVDCVFQYFVEIVKQILSDKELSTNRKYVYFTLLRCFDEFDPYQTLENMNHDTESSDNETKTKIEEMRETLIQVGRNKRNKQPYYAALQKLREEFNIKALEEIRRNSKLSEK